MKRHGVSEGQAASLEPRRPVTHPLVELVEEARFPDPGFPDQEDGVRLTGRRACEGILQEVELALPPNERGQAPVSVELETGAPQTRRHHVPGGHRLGLALERERPEGLHLEVARGEAIRRLRGHHVARARRLLHPGRDVGRVAHRGVIHAQVVTDATDDDEARVEALADAKRDPVGRPELVLIGIERLADAECRVHGPPGVVLVRHRGAEQRHDPVTEELVDRPLVAMHLGEHQLERSPHEPVDVLGIEPLGDGGEAGHVNEEDGDLLPLAFEGGLGSQDLLGEVARRVRVG